MPYCTRCGVEVDNYVKECPLCQTHIQKLSKEEETVRKFPLHSKLKIKNPLTRRQKRDVTWAVLTLLIFIPIGVILAIRFLYKKDFTWEGYTLVSLGAFWVYISLFLFFIKKQPLILGGLFLNTSALLFLIDNLNGKFEWFFNIALPITVLFYLILAGLIFVIRYIKKKGTNILGFILLGIVVCCIGIDLTLSFAIFGSFVPKWSIIVIVALTPVALFLLYLHYFVKTDFDLRKKFHI